MKIYLFAICILLNIFSLKAQSSLSKDIFLEKTIYAVVDSIKNSKLVKNIDTLFVNDKTLKYSYKKFGSCAMIIVPEYKDTIINQIKIRTLPKFPVIIDKPSKPYNPPINYYLQYQISHATDSSIIITYTIQRYFFKKLFLKPRFGYLDSFHTYYFTLDSDINLRESYKIRKSNN